MLSAEIMAQSISKAINKKAQSKSFKTKCFLGQDVSKEIWETICQQIIEHLKNNIEIEIPALNCTVSNGNMTLSGNTSKVTIKNIK